MNHCYRFAKIKKIKSLLDKEILTQKEYEAEKKKILEGGEY